MRVEITDGVIPAAEIVAGIKTGPDGAVCVFDGIVRDNTRGRKTLYLDYEAYREMALEQMRGLAAEAVTRFGVRDVALVHRLGRLRVGETSVLVVVASAHRGAAFDACRWLIDTLKKSVPIWKKEQFVDGAVWADGEPFPSEIGIRGKSGAEVRSVDGSGEEDGRPLGDAHISESRYGAPGSVRERDVEGGPSDDAPILESRAPRADGSGRESGRPVRLRSGFDNPPFAKSAKDGAPDSVPGSVSGSMPGSVGSGRRGAGK